MIYRKVLTRLWRDRQFLALSAPQPNAQTLWLYLLTSDVGVALPGAVPAGPLSLAERLAWPVDATSDALRELEDAGFVTLDARAPLVWIGGVLAQRIHRPDNPNVAHAWGASVELLPECALRDCLLGEVREYLVALGDEYRRAFEDGLAKGYGNGSPNGSANQ